jgi:DNA-binding NtrC family response regulator
MCHRPWPLEIGEVLEVADSVMPVICATDPHSRANSREHRAPDPGIFQGLAEKSPRHVLVVDDEPLIRWSVSESLVDLGFDVEQAADANAALRAVTTSTPFDVMVVDLRLPDMGDLSLLGTLRQLAPSATLILMTAFGTPEIIDDATAMGAAVLHKPFELDELRRLIVA